MLRVKVIVEDKTWVFGLPVDATLGAGADNTLVLSHGSVAMRHARLQWEDDQLWLEALAQGPGRPTTLNGSNIERAPLAEGDVFSLGAYTFELLTPEAPSPTEDGFLAAIARQPSDDATRAVYADWLEEQGRSDAARFLRAQLELRTVAAETERFHVLAETLEELGRKMPPGWRRAIARPAIEGCAVRFELACPKTWDALQPTAHPDQRHCSTCAKTVHYAKNVPTARRLALAGECVAVDIVVERSEGDLAPRQFPMMAGRIVPPDWANR